MHLCFGGRAVIRSLGGRAKFRRGHAFGGPDFDASCSSFFQRTLFHYFFKFGSPLTGRAAITGVRGPGPLIRPFWGIALVLEMVATRGYLVIRMSITMLITHQLILCVLIATIFYQFPSNMVDFNYKFLAKLLLKK